MSVEQAKTCIEKMKTDEAFRERIMALDTPEDQLKAIEDAGYDCTSDEINEAGAEVAAGLVRGATNDRLKPG
ncbi:MAG: Nif11-like leader peptide family natural product precursor [Chlorobiaceae bacterium]|nr:Nif11-like leader peptide family natural product precursor [Chlorobiaceae bacterium]